MPAADIRTGTAHRETPVIGQSWRAGSRFPGTPSRRPPAVPSGRFRWSAVLTAVRGSLTAHFLGAQLLVGATALVINVLAARALEPAGRGQLALAIQLGYVLSVFVLLGADRAYPAAGDGVTESGEALTDLGRLIRIPAAAVVVACGAAGLVLSSRLPLAFPYAMGVALLALSSSAVLAVRAGAIVSRRSRPYLTSVVAGQLLLLLAGTALVVAPRSQTLWWLLSYGACTGVPLVVIAAGQLRPHQRTQPAADPSQRLAQARALRWRLAPSALSTLVMLRLDRLLIPWLASNRQLGLYIVVATMTELLYWPVQHYVDSHLPIWRSRHRAGSLPIRRVIFGTAVYLTAAGVAAGVAIRLLIVPLFGPEYAESRSLVLPLVVAACCYGAGRVGVGLSLATGRVRAPALSDGAGALVTAALCFALIPHHGAMGAALASLAGYLAAAAVSLVACAGRSSQPDARRHRPQGAA